MDFDKIKQLNERTKRIRENPVLNVARDMLNEPKESEQKYTEEKQPNTAFLEKRFQVLLEMSIKQFQNELNQLNEKIYLLHDQVGVIQQTVSKLQHNQRLSAGDQLEKQHPAFIKTQTEQLQATVQNTNPQFAKEQVKPPPQNTVNAEDVTIEKFFYFGKGKK